MKLAIGMNLQSGAWGGGNRFGHSLASYMRARGVEVSFDLRCPDLDIILLTEPRGRLKISSFTDREIFHYLRSVNPGALVVHRINECDERKETRGLNQRLALANQCADYTVFISQWLSDLLRAYIQTSYSVIRNGADARFFNASGFKPWQAGQKMRIFTHHWGRSPMKGWDIYRRLDKMLSQKPIRDLFEFTYVGQVPRGYSLSHSSFVSPQDGDRLASTIKSHHVYLTASQNEPAGMHHIEGGMCGLPLLYRESGALPEYCQGFGLSFTENNFEEKLLEIHDSYNGWPERLKMYPFSAERMCDDYFQLFNSLYEKREELILKRKWWKRFSWKFSMGFVHADN